MNDNFHTFPHYLKEDVMKYLDVMSTDVNHGVKYPIGTDPVDGKHEIVVNFDSLINRGIHCPIKGKHTLDFDENTQVFYSHESRIIIGVKEMIQYFSK